MKLLFGLIFSALALNIHAEQADLTPTKSGMYDVGGFKLYIECYENDKPSLILEQGFGRWGSDGVWKDNISKLTSDFSVCLYDRAGLGKSDKGPVPFDVTDMAERLNKLLNAAEIKAPHYFAGGSYASYIITAYHKNYPNEVSGVMLIDPPPFGYFHTMATRWPDNFTTDNEQLARYFQFEQSVKDPMFSRVPENVDHIKSYKLLKSAQSFGEKPLVVVRAKQSDERYDPPFVPDDIAVKMDTLYNQSEESFRSLSVNSKVVYSTSPKHHLHITDPELVVKSIQSLVK